MISVDQARQIVLETFYAKRLPLTSEQVLLEDSPGRVLAEDILADMDIPSFDRSIKDGYAVSSTDVQKVPAVLRVVGESKAGEARLPELSRGEAVQIMTGAAVPPGADAVVMVEDTVPSDSPSVSQQSSFDSRQIRVLKSVSAGSNISYKGSESKSGEVLATRGRCMRVHEVSLAASVGCSTVEVYRKPRVAIIATGDELVPVEGTPGTNQIRNSNSYSLGSMVQRSGGVPTIVGIAKDSQEDLKEKIVAGLVNSECLLLTGGVSAGKYDFVETVLEKLGCKFKFDSIAIRPGKPAVFGTVENKFVFALPGNPVSAIVTFELFVSPLLSLLAGENPSDPLILKARLESAFHQPMGRRGFLPACYQLRDGDMSVNLVRWKGSSDLAGLAKSNCFLIAPENQAEFKEGDWVRVLLASF